MPSRERVGRMMLLLGAIAICQACDPDVTPTPTQPTPVVVIPPTIFIPDFTFVWRDKATDAYTVQYTFAANEVKVASGTFNPNGSSEQPKTPAAFNPIKGSFNGRDLTITITRKSADGKSTIEVPATGHFTDDNTIQLTFTSTTLTLVRVKV